MTIAIIGGGWVGCHLAYKLKDKHLVRIFDKNKELFTETSYNNQNRLHYGYHYARNHKTRELCKDTFDKFIKDYSFLTLGIEKNYYCVPKKESIIDLKTYKKIYSDFNFKDTDFTMDNIEGCINTNEQWIDFLAAKRFFNIMLEDNFVTCKVDDEKLNDLKLNYDYVINATNNFIQDKSVENNFYELTLSLIYEKNKDLPFDALTLVDGDFFSIYPYEKNLFTLTDVEYTPLKKFDNIKSLKKYKKQIKDSFIEHKKSLIETNVCKYYKNFTNDFNYHSYMLSVKSKIKDKSDDRYPNISIDGNLINCFTGKIQGIYIIEEYVNNILKQYD